MNFSDEVFRFSLPNHRTLIIQPKVILEIKNYLQKSSASVESGGYLIGYQSSRTQNITLEDITFSPMDTGTRIGIRIQKKWHKFILSRFRRQRSYYMGTWHTHPSSMPHPSEKDLLDWDKSLRYESTGTSYMFFLIAGTYSWNLWIGDFATGKISNASVESRGES